MGASNWSPPRCCSKRSRRCSPARACRSTSLPRRPSGSSPTSPPRPSSPPTHQPLTRPSVASPTTTISSLSPPPAAPTQSSRRPRLARHRPQPTRGRNHHAATARRPPRLTRLLTSFVYFVLRQRVTERDGRPPDGKSTHRRQKPTVKRRTPTTGLKIQFRTVCWFSLRVEATSATVMSSSDAIRLGLSLELSLLAERPGWMKSSRAGAIGWQWIATEAVFTVRVRSAVLVHPAETRSC
jgi:hypothetical protein